MPTVFGGHRQLVPSELHSQLVGTAATLLSFQKFYYCIGHTEGDTDAANFLVTETLWLRAVFNIVILIVEGNTQYTRAEHVLTNYTILLYIIQYAIHNMYTLELYNPINYSLSDIL